MTPLDLLRMISSDLANMSYGDISHSECFLYDALDTDISDSERLLIEEALVIYQNLARIFINYDYHTERSEQLKGHEY